MNFEVNGKTYAATKLPVMVQLHLTRRLAPVLSVLPNVDENGEKVEGTVISRMMNAICEMSEPDVNWIVISCLSVTQKIVEGSPPITLAKGGHVMDDSLSLPDLLQIVQKIIEENLGGFFGAAGTLG